MQVRLPHLPGRPHLDLTIAQLSFATQYFYMHEEKSQSTFLLLLHIFAYMEKKVDQH